MGAIHSGTLLSAEAFSELPDAPGKQELLEGELIVLPPAKLSHSKVEKALSKLFTSVLDEARVYIESGYQLTPETWLQPDVSVAWPDQRVSNDYLQGAPMIAIEVVSRGNTVREIDRQVKAYLNCGAAEVWILYPKTRSMTVHTSGRVVETSENYTSTTVLVTLKLPEIFRAS